MALCIIFARTENHCIGHNGQVPWKLPSEYASFEQITAGKAIIMGRRSYADHHSLLEGRFNIVVTRNADYPLVEGIQRASDLDEALSLAAEYADKNTAADYFVIGGVDLIIKSMPLAKTVYETIVHTCITGDTFLPNFEFSGWSTEIIQNQAVDQQHAYAYTVYKHQRA